MDEQLAIYISMNADHHADGWMNSILKHTGRTSLMDSAAASFISVKLVWHCCLPLQSPFNATRHFPLVHIAGKFFNGRNGQPWLCFLRRLPTSFRIDAGSSFPQKRVWPLLCYDIWTDLRMGWYQRSWHSSSKYTLGYFLPCRHQMFWYSAVYQRSFLSKKRPKYGYWWWPLPHLWVLLFLQGGNSYMMISAGTTKIEWKLRAISCALRNSCGDFISGGQSGVRLESFYHTLFTNPRNLFIKKPSRLNREGTTKNTSHSAYWSKFLIRFLTIQESIDGTDASTITFILHRIIAVKIFNRRGVVV